MQTTQFASHSNVQEILTSNVAPSQFSFWVSLRSTDVSAGIEEATNIFQVIDPDSVIGPDRLLHFQAVERWSVGQNRAGLDVLFGSVCEAPRMRLRARSMKFEYGNDS